MLQCTYCRKENCSRGKKTIEGKKTKDGNEDRITSKWQRLHGKDYHRVTTQDAPSEQEGGRGNKGLEAREISSPFFLLPSASRLQHAAPSGALPRTTVPSQWHERRCYGKKHNKYTDLPHSHRDSSASVWVWTCTWPWRCVLNGAQPFFTVNNGALSLWLADVNDCGKYVGAFHSLYSFVL